MEVGSVICNCAIENFNARHEALKFRFLYGETCVDGGYECGWSWKSHSLVCHRIGYFISDNSGIILSCYWDSAQLRLAAGVFSGSKTFSPKISRTNESKLVRYSVWFGACWASLLPTMLMIGLSGVCQGRSFYLRTSYPLKPDRYRDRYICVWSSLIAMINFEVCRLLIS